MTRNEITGILIDNYKGCEAEQSEFWGISVSLSFNKTPEVEQILKGYISEDTESENICWVWMHFATDDLYSTFYFLVHFRYRKISNYQIYYAIFLAMILNKQEIIY
jgi:hypothetical protein